MVICSHFHKGRCSDDITPALVIRRLFNSSVALFVLFAGTAWAWVVGVYLLLCTLLGSAWGRCVLVGARYLGSRFTLHLLLYADMEQNQIVSSWMEAIMDSYIS